MKVFLHHIYEYQKGLRYLVLHTMKFKYKEHVEQKLIFHKIPYVIRSVNEKKMNVFFGDLNCINVIKAFGDKPLHDYTDEQDFILGTMLGYCRRKQCIRYLSRKQKNKDLNYREQVLHNANISMNFN